MNFFAFAAMVIGSFGIGVQFFEAGAPWWMYANIFTVGMGGFFAGAGCRS